MKKFIIFIFILFLVPTSTYAVADTAVFAYRSGSAQSIPSSTGTVLQLNAEVFDVGSDFDTSTYAFTAPENGYYDVSFSVRWNSANDANYYQVAVLKNGSSEPIMITGLPGGTGVLISNGSGLVYLNSGDYLQLNLYQTSGVSEDVSAASNGTFFSISRVILGTDIPAVGSDVAVTFADDTIQNFNWYFLILIFLLCSGYMISIYRHK